MARQRYTSDLPDAQWQRIEEVLPPAKGGRTGRPRKYEQREMLNMLNAMLYLLRTGSQWRNLPHDFPPHGSVWELFRRWRDNGTLESVHQALRAQVRVQSGRDEAPSVAILDSQSVKTTEKGGPKASTRTRK